MNGLKFVIRQFRRQPAFALLAALTLALGIGPTVAIFGIVNAPAAISDITERVRTLPGVATVTFSSDHPMSGTRASHGLPTLEGYEPRAGEPIQFDSAQVGPAFFHTIGMPLLRGTEISLRDVGSDERKALVNESFVRRYWPDQEAIGRRVIGLDVIGVVKDSRIFDLTEEPAPLVCRQAVYECESEELQRPDRLA